jgi:chromosome segregation ATPase
MVEAPSIEALRSALAPVEALRGEQSQLETFVGESFASLDALHGELAEWQRDLTRRQAELDQREAALADAESIRGSATECDSKLNEQLAQSREELRQLEDENADQFQAIDELDRQLIAAQAELRVLRKHTEELSIALETECERSIDEHRHWTGELREMRQLLERQGETLAWLAGGEHGDEHCVDAKPLPTPRVAAGGDDGESAADVKSRTAELRRRASTRRAVHRRPA